MIDNLICIEKEILVDTFRFVEGVIYKVKNYYDFEYVISNNTGNYYICDCFPCNENGEILEGYICPIPINYENIEYYIL